jgi:hypothetical protein
MRDAGLDDESHYEIITDLQTPGQGLLLLFIIFMLLVSQNSTTQEGRASEQTTSDLHTMRTW